MTTFRSFAFHCLPLYTLLLYHHALLAPTTPPPCWFTCHQTKEEQWTQYIGDYMVSETYSFTSRLFMIGASHVKVTPNYYMTLDQNIPPVAPRTPLLQFMTVQDISIVRVRFFFCYLHNFWKWSLFVAISMKCLLFFLSFYARKIVKYVLLVGCLDLFLFYSF